MKNNYVRHIVYGSVIAAAYTALSLLLAPWSYGIIQFRISEVLTILPLFTPAAIPGLFAGCLISNVFGGAGIYDIVLGSLATLIAAFLTWKLRKNKIFALMPPVLVNAVIVGAYLFYIFNRENMPMYLSMLLVGAGQLGVVYILGYPLSLLIEKYNLIKNP